MSSPWILWVTQRILKLSGLKPKKWKVLPSLLIRNFLKWMVRKLKSKLKDYRGSNKPSLRKEDKSKQKLRISFSRNRWLLKISKSSTINKSTWSQTSTGRTSSIQTTFLTWMMSTQRATRMRSWEGISPNMPHRCQWTKHPTARKTVFTRTRAFQCTWLCRCPTRAWPQCTVLCSSTTPRGSSLCQNTLSRSMCPPSASLLSRTGQDRYLTTRATSPDKWVRIMEIHQAVVCQSSRQRTTYCKYS